MRAEKLFVALLALILGLLALVGAIHNHDWYFRLSKARWIDKRFGRTITRVIYVAIGLGLLVVAISLAFGWRI